MKYYFIVLSFVLSSLGAFGQDTLQISRFDLADSVYGQLSNLNIPSGRLINRLFVPNMDSTVSHVFSGVTSDTVTADYMYGFLVEKKNMSLDTSLVPHYHSVFQEAMVEMTKEEYEDQKTVIPFAIHEYSYQRMDTTSAELTFSNLQYSDNGALSASAFSTHRTVAIGPLFEFLSEDVLYLHLKSEWIFTNKGVSKVEIFYDDKWRNFAVDQLFEYHATLTDVQWINFRITFEGEKIPVERVVEIKTPGLKAKSSEKIYSECDEGQTVFTDYVDSDNNKLKWCLIKGCNSVGANIVDKPFILVTGYRPPIFDHSFRKIYKRHNQQMNHFLENLHNFGYDVYIIRFNYSQKTYKHGMAESADLLREFIYDVNERKTQHNLHNENIIMGNSFGADVSRMALMQMEKDHFDGTTDRFHHTRLLIANDAQFYGANIPLSMQYMVASEIIYPNFSMVYSIVLNSFLGVVMSAKSFKEPVMYHFKTGQFTFPWNPFANHDITPSHHWRRQGILDRFNNLDRDPSRYPIPMPLDVRNVAISLGRYDVPNYLDNQGEAPFVAPGGQLNNNFIFQNKKALSAKHTNYYWEIFRRRMGTTFFGQEMNIFRQRMAVKDMYEVDGTSGSFLKGFGNFTAVWNFGDQFLFSFADNTRFSHKPVLSALAINQNLWPGSAHLNLHDLDLMWQKRGFNIDQGDVQSSFFGYPNLGDPDNHFNITPFEAIYCDNKYDPHIDLKDSDGAYKDSLINFLNQEIEPHWLVLQNHTLGIQCREQFRYKAKRRAKEAIYISYDLSPQTGIGPYVIKKNAELLLSTGGYFAIPEPDTTTSSTGVVIFEVEEGGVWEANVVDWDECNAFKNNEQESFDAWNEQPKPDYIEGLENTKSNLELSAQLFPNPSKNEVTIELSDRKRSIEKIVVYSMEGRVMFQHIPLEKSNVSRITPHLEEGNYVVVIWDNHRKVYRLKFLRL